MVTGTFIRRPAGPGVDMLRSAGRRRPGALTCKRSPSWVAPITVAADVGLSDLLWRPAWHKDALCVHHPDVEFFVDSTGDTGPAKRLCARCPVHDECLAY